MQRGLTVLLSTAVIFISTTAAAAAESPSTTVYRLSDRSTYQRGCFPPCLCPLLEQVPVRGTFTLTPSGSDGVFSTFTVSDVRWLVSGAGASEVLITGAGTYTIGGEVALQQQLELDLVIDGAAVQHFDSGLVAADGVPFPALNVTVSMNHLFCHDTVIVVNAAPAEPCIGDCSGDGVVTIDEIVTGVAMALEDGAADHCPAFECNPGGRGVAVNCVVMAVRAALDGCGPVPRETPGACCRGDCTAATTECSPWTQDACCDYARTSAIALAIWWCPPEQFDPATHHCAACVDPCLSLPPGGRTPTPTPGPPDLPATETLTPSPDDTPYPLPSLQAPCGSETGAAVLASVRPEYDATLMSRPETPWSALVPFTLRLTYRGGAITCYPRQVLPPESERPIILEQVGLIMEVQFNTENGAFAETVDAELKGGAHGGALCFSRRPADIEGTYRPNLPGYDDVLVGVCGNFAGDWTNGVVFQTGVPPGHVSQFIPIAYWQPIAEEATD